MADDPEYILIDTAVVSPELKGTAKQVVFQGSKVGMSAFGMETEETYHVAIGDGQLPAARAFVRDCLLDEKCLNAELELIQGERIVIKVSWAYDRNDTEWTPGSDPYQWDFDVMETSQALASHPYFTRRTLSEEGNSELMKEIGVCDERPAAYWLDPKRISAPSDVLKIIMSRYAGLLNCGVQEWSPITIMLQARHRLFPSQTAVSDDNTGDYAWSELLYGVNQVMSLDWWQPPETILAAITSLQALVYPDDGSLTPEFEPGSFMWIRMKPQVRLSGRNPNGPSDIIDYLLGVQQASEVLYPPFPKFGSNPPNLWDPKRNVLVNPLKA